MITVIDFQLTSLPGADSKQKKTGNMWVAGFTICSLTPLGDHIGAVSSSHQRYSVMIFVVIVWCIIHAMEGLFV